MLGLFSNIDLSECILYICISSAIRVIFDQTFNAILNRGLRYRPAFGRKYLIFIKS